MAAIAPVRPGERELRALLHALALTGVGSARLRACANDAAGTTSARKAAAEQLTAELAADRATSDPARAAVFERLAERVSRRLSPGEKARARGWGSRALATIRTRGLHVLTPRMPQYPPRLLHLDVPPYPLFAEGRLELLDGPAVAVVGTRACTATGLEAASRIAVGIAAAGVAVVSGLARGIDGAAHRAAGPSRTIGVLGCGIDVSYPRQHADLQAAIGREGLLLSEQLPGTPAAAYNFPRRNRILAALATGVVVVEAPATSGALITAGIAADLGRTVCAVPGAVNSPASEGSNALIRDGAELVTSAAEVLSTLDLPLPPPEAEDAPPPELTGVGLALWRSMGACPRHVDELSGELGLDVGQGLASLLALEIQGHARQLPGLRFARG